MSYIVILLSFTTIFSSIGYGHIKVKNKNKNTPAVGLNHILKFA